MAAHILTMLKQLYVNYALFWMSFIYIYIYIYKYIYRIQPRGTLPHSIRYQIWKQMIDWLVGCAIYTSTTWNFVIFSTGLKHTCNRINECNTRRSQSMASLASRSSRRSSTIHSSSRSSRSASSRSSGSAASSTSSGSISLVSSENTSFRSAENITSQSSSDSICSRSSSGSNGSSVESSIDAEVLDIQARLVFCEHVQTFQLATATRHVIYSGQLTHIDENGPSEVHII